MVAVLYPLREQNVILPYRVKNPPKHFPIATVTLMAINILVFAATSYRFLEIRPEMLQQYALRWGVTSSITILTSTFLHADIFHLGGNMLFLWVFGPAVEDRLRIPGYLGLYVLTGFAGSVAHVMLGSVSGAPIPTLGASGCIMGVLGASPSETPATAGEWASDPPPPFTSSFQAYPRRA